MDWSAFFAAAGLARQDSFAAWQPGALRGVAALVASQPLDAWKDYLRFHLLDRYADVLPKEFADAALAFHGAAGGTHSTPPRAQRALDATQAALSDALGRAYAERYFPARQKARVLAIVADVVAAFERRLDAVTWMSPRSRAIALAKVRALYVGVGYPEQWEDFSDLTIDPRDAVGNLRRVSERIYRHAVARLGRPVDRTEWLIAPQRVGAILAFQQNAYDFTAALLQTPKYDSTASDAAAYGAIGAIIGHDVTHYVDVLGAEYEVDGRERRWWTPEDSAGFAAAARPLVDQVSAYRPFPDLALNGALTRTENVADLGGLVSAFDAYRATLGDRRTDTAYVRAQDREFFLGFARSWRAKLTDAALRAQVVGGDHAPDQYRVDIVRNLDAWYDAFDVRPGDRLYLPPDQRVRIW
jgi:predicted metalloendopeptidase